MDTLTGASIGGLIGATNIKVGDLTRSQRVAVLALAGAILVNLHKEIYKSPIDQPISAMEAYKFKDSKRV